MKNKFRIRGFVNKNGDKQYFVEKKNLFTWETYCIKHITYDKDSCFIEGDINTIFDCPNLAKEIAVEHYKLEDVCKKQKITMVYDESSRTLKFIPNSNLNHYHYFWTNVINDKFIYSLLDQAVEKEKFLNKKWIEEYFEVEKI